LPSGQATQAELLVLLGRLSQKNRRPRRAWKERERLAFLFSFSIITQKGRPLQAAFLNIFI